MTAQLLGIYLNSVHNGMINKNNFILSQVSACVRPNKGSCQARQSLAEINLFNSENDTDAYIQSGKFMLCYMRFFW